MLYDSCSQVCGRQQCRAILMFLAAQQADYRQEFWLRFDAAQRDATSGGLKRWNLEEMMAEAMNEVVETAA